MKKSAITFLSLVLAVGFADRGGAQTFNLAPPAPSADETIPAPGLPPLPSLDSAVAPANAFILPGASSGSTVDASFDAAARASNDKISLDSQPMYGAGSGAAPDYNRIPTSRDMAPLNGPVNRPTTLDSDTAGRVINNSYDGDWLDYCGPTGRSCCSQIYGSIDAILLDRKDSTRKAIALNSVNSTFALQTTDPNFRWDHVAPKLTVGRLFCDWAIEGSAIYIDNISAHADSSPSVFGNTAVFFGAQPIGSNYTNAQMRLDIYDGFHSYELNAVDTRSFFQMIYGVRYIEFREQLSVQSTTLTGTSGASIGTYNRMIGGQIGVRMEYMGELADFEFNLKGGIYQNEANMGTNIRDFNNSTLLRSTHNDGQNEAYLAEMNLFLTHRLTNNVKIRYGYQLIYITEIALAPDQIDENRTATNLTGFLPDAHGDMFMRGFTAGAEFRW